MVPTDYGSSVSKSEVGQIPLKVDRISASADREASRSIESWLYSPFFVPTVLAVLTAAMLAGALFVPGDKVLSLLGNDTSNIFVFSRMFWLEQAKTGNFPLINPHIYGGVPFFGTFFSEMLYPINWVLYFVLPFAKAIDYEFALHIFLMGLFTALWAEYYGLHPVAALVAACGAMFCTPFFGSLLAGHLAHMDTMAWTPLILLTVDRLVDEPSVNWVLIGIFAFAMQIFAGYPQVLFITIVSCAIFGGLRTFQARRPLMTIIAVLIVGGGAAMIGAAQLWAGLQAAGEGPRAGGISFGYASSLSLTFDNLFTLLVPNVYGNVGLPFWGGNGATVFFGTTAFLLSLFGITVKSRHRMIFIASAAAILVIALGKYTPVFDVLYRFVPGFNLFRRPAAFTYSMLIFMAMLSGFGLDALIRSADGAKKAGVVVAILATALAAFGAVARYSTSSTFDGIWDWLFHLVMRSEHLFPTTTFDNRPFIEQAKRFAGGQSVIAAAICIAVAALLLIRRKQKWASYALAGLAIADAFVFACPGVYSFDLAQTVPVQEKEFIAAHPGDYRILNPDFDGLFGLSVANSAVAVGANDIWGYDPTVAKRYTQLMTYSQGQDVDEADMALWFTRVTTSVWRLMRLRYIYDPAAVMPVVKLSAKFPTGHPKNPIWPVGDGFYQLPGDLPHVLLVDGWQRLDGRDRILPAVNSPTFDGGKNVILESNPEPAPAGGAATGTVKLIDRSTDWLEIAADVTQPTLLLITDAYSKYYRATGLRGSAQSEYHVMPADYALMAIPLPAGHHRIRLEYAPSGWFIGRWISLLGLIAYLGAVIWFVLRQRQESGSPA